MKLNFTCSFYTVLIVIVLIYDIVSKYAFDIDIHVNVTELWIFFILLVLVDILAELRRK